MAVLVLWVVSQLLDRLTSFRPPVAAPGAPEGAGGSRFVQVGKALKSFLTAVKDDVDVAVLDAVLVQVTSVSPSELAVDVLELIGDADRLITHHITAGHFAAALRVLEALPRDAAGKTEGLWSRHSPALIVRLPVEVVAAWRRQPWLDTTTLLPALCAFDAAYAARTLPTQAAPPPVGAGGAVGDHHAAAHLLWLMRERRRVLPPAVQNCLVAMLARLPNPQPLRQLLDLPPGDLAVDLAYALRVCSAAGKHEACVQLYAQMGFLEDAVGLALHLGDVALAERVVAKARDDQLERKLWLMVARHLIVECHDPRRALALAQAGHCALEDLLEFFSDLAALGELRDDIISALERNAHAIEELKTSMSKATEAADDIRRDTTELRSSRFGYVLGSQQCDVCGAPAVARAFCVFPACRHVVHESCLMQAVLPTLPRAAAERVVLLASIAAGVTPAGPVPSGGLPNATAAGEELENVLAEDCPFCGDAAISSLTQPLATDVDDTAWRF